jgi:MFS family permease
MCIMALLIPTFLVIPLGIPFTIGLAVLGLVFFSVMPIITAAAQDSAGSGSEGSVTAMMFLGLSLVSLCSPPIAGKIYDSAGFDGVIIFCTIVAVTGALLAIILPTPPLPKIRDTVTEV